LTGINWTDVGCWDTLSEIYKGDQQGNFFNGDVLSIDTANSFVFSHDKLVTLIGIKDCIVINTKDAVLIAKKGESQKVKEVIKALKDGRQIEL
jgi:mannose-1-phosphate guanylyltransferase